MPEIDGVAVETVSQAELGGELPPVQNASSWVRDVRASRTETRLSADAEPWFALPEKAPMPTRLGAIVLSAEAVGWATIRTVPIYLVP